MGEYTYKYTWAWQHIQMTHPTPKHTVENWKERRDFSLSLVVLWERRGCGAYFHFLWEKILKFGAISSQMPSPPPALHHDHHHSDLWKLYCQIWTQGSSEALGHLCCRSADSFEQLATQSLLGKMVDINLYLRIYSSLQCFCPSVIRERI